MPIDSDEPTAAMQRTVRQLVSVARRKSRSGSIVRTGHDASRDAPPRCLSVRSFTQVMQWPHVLAHVELASAHWPPYLLQMAGGSGAGKSTLARLLGERTGAVVVDLDVVKTAALDAGSSWDLAGRIGYEASRTLADSLLGQRRSVILDSPCRFQQIVDGGSAIAVQHSVPYAFIECVLADEQERCSDRAEANGQENRA